MLAKFDIDGRQLKALLAVYLKQDLRGGKAFLQSGAREYATSNLSMLAIVALYTLTGLAMAFMVLAGTDVLIYSTVLHSFTLLVVALAIVVESSSVIFNESEPDIIGHLPITSRTLFAAKTLNLLLFGLLIAAAANLFPLIAGVWAGGSNLMFLPAHALSTLLIAVFATSLVVSVYGVLMRWVSRERFDNLVAYAQVALVLFFMLGYQVVPRLLDLEQLQEPRPIRWYYLFYPPVWFAGLDVALVGRPEPGALAGGLLAIAAVVWTALVALRKVSLTYAAAVTQLAYGAKTRPAKEGAAARRSPAWARAVKKRWLRKPVERAVFDLVAIYFVRDRDIKVRVYPSLAYFPVFPLLGLLTGDFADPFAGDFDGMPALLGAGMLSFIALMAVESLVFSSHFHAAYMFHVAPVASLGEIHAGFRKAVLAMVTLPGLLLLFALYSILWRDPWHALLLLLPWAAVAPAVMMLSFLRRETLPLARPYRKGQQAARNIGIVMVAFGLMGVGLTAQMLALRGAIPYGLFLAGAFAASFLIYVTLRRLSGEDRPLGPLDETAAPGAG